MTVLRVLSFRFWGSVTVVRVLSLAARSAAGKCWVFGCTDARERDMRDCAEGLGLGLSLEILVTHAYSPTYEKIQL